MKYAAVLLLTSFFSINMQAQSATDSVEAVINTLFKSMRDADAALFRSCFTDSAILQTIKKSPSGAVSVASENLKAFASFIEKQEKNALNEKIVFKKILIDADLASVWTPYTFHFKNKYSHCGVNSFQLVRLPEGWKIQYLIDTRRNDCKE